MSSWALIASSLCFHASYCCAFGRPQSNLQDAEALRKRLRDEFDVEAVIFAKDGRGYNRLAHQVYVCARAYGSVCVQRRSRTM